MIPMTEFVYVRPHTLDEALALLAEPGANRVLAGGTDFVVQARRGEITCDRVIDIMHLPELRGIHISDSGKIVLGAAVTFSAMLDHAALCERVPLLAEACRAVGGVQIRNRATVGGNVANAAICADIATALVCLDAVAHIVTPDGEIAHPVQDVIAGPRQTTLTPGALIRAFTFQAPPDPARTAYLRVERRQAATIARVSLAAAGRLTGGRIAAVRLVPGAAFERPQRITAVEDMLTGQPPTEDLFVAAGQRMSAIYEQVMGARGSAAYKSRVLAALTERALRHCFRT